MDSKLELKDLPHSGDLFNEHVSNNDDGSTVYTDNERPNQLFLSANRCYKEKLFTDVTVVIDKSRFEAHRLVLASLSDYFIPFLKMDQGSDGVITLKDICQAEIFDILLRYAYTKELHLTNDNVQSILTAADYFSIDFVKKSCELFMADNLDVENVCDVIKFANHFSLEYLHDCAEKFISYNLEPVSHTAEFLNIDSNFLISFIEKNDLVLYNNKIILKSVEREEFVFKAVLRYIANVLPNDITFCEQLLKAVRLPIIPKIRIKTLTKSYEILKEFKSLFILFDYADAVRNISKGKGTFQKGVDETQIPESWWHPRAFTACKIVNHSRGFATGGHVGSVNGPPSFIHSDQSIQIKKVEVWIRSWEGTPIIGGIAITYHSPLAKDLQRYSKGAMRDSWARHEMVLEPGEFIIKVIVGSGYLIDRLGFVTNSGKTFGPFGGDGGSEHTVYAPRAEQSYLYDINCEAVNTQGAPAIFNLMLKWITFD